ncbi:hypothetical protein Bca4012_087785 [Brassica carinata]
MSLSLLPEHDDGGHYPPKLHLDVDRTAIISTDKKENYKNDKLQELRPCQCWFRPDSGEREFRSVLGPTRNKLQRKLPEMKLKKKKKKHMKSKYEKTKNLGTPASPTTTLKQSRTVDAEASLLLPDFSVVSNVFKKKQDSEQSTAELALEKDDDDITVEQAWDDIVQRVKFLSADHPLGSHLRATLQRDGERHGSVHVMSSLHLIQRSTIAIKLSILKLVN